MFEKNERVLKANRVERAQLLLECMERSKAKSEEHPVDSGWYVFYDDKYERAREWLRKLWGQLPPEFRRGLKGADLKMPGE